MGYAGKVMRGCKKIMPPLHPVPKSTQESIPIQAIAEDGIFLLEQKPGGQDRLYDKAYLFTDTNFSIKEEEEKESYFKLYTQFLNSLGVSFKILVMNNNRNMEKIRQEVFLKCSDARYRELVDEMNQRIKKSLESGMNGIEQTRVFVISCERQDIDRARDFFRTLEANLILSFRRLGSTLIPCGAEERLRLLHAFYRLGKEEEYRFNYAEAFRKRADWRNDICNLAIKECRDETGHFDGKTLEYDGRYVRVLFARQFPNSISDKFMQDITSVSFHTITTLDCAPIPQNIAKARFMDLYMNNGRSIEKQQEQRNRARAFSSDISYDKRREKEEIEGYLDILTENDEKLLYLALYVVVTAFDKEELESYCITLDTIAKGYGIALEPAYADQRNAVNTALPVAARYYDAMRPVFTQSMCGFVPFNVQELYHPGGIFYGCNRVSKNIVVGDRKRLTNGNGFILGTTGSGKSVEAKCEMTQAVVNTEDDLIVIDPQNEYRELADNFHGQFINISSESQNHINPLDVSTLGYMESRDAFIADKTELMLGICEQILKHENTAGQRSIISRCVRKVYQEYFEGKCRKSPTMEEFYGMVKQQGEREARDIELALELFVEGALNVFAKPTNVNTESRILVYGIADLGKDLSSVGMLVMLESIRARIARNYRKGKVTWLYIDEFHNLASQPVSAAFLEKIWKEVRKLGGMVTGITQNIADLLKTKTVETMLCNSEYLNLLKQSDIEIDIFRDMLRFNENILEFVNNSECGCGILKFGDILIPKDNRLGKDSLLYRMVNTNFHEIHAKKPKKKEVLAAFDSLASDKAKAMEDEPYAQAGVISMHPERE